MTDVVSPNVRSRMMSGIQGTNTKPEITIRKALFAKGYRYLLHYKKLPGKPDLVLPKYNAVVFVHGCFWHRHDCHLFKWPSTRKEFWEEKINGNATRDGKQIQGILDQNWRVLIIWECAIKGKEKRELSEIISMTEAFLGDRTRYLEIKGKHQ